MFTVVTHMNLNMGAIRAKITQALNNSANVRKAAYNKAYGVFRNAKRMMLNEFDRHNITQEIAGGPTADNISGTLDGYGNLFSFIGFHEGDKPVERLRQILESRTVITRTSYDKRNREWHFSISLPDKGEIESVTEMPWEGGNSWAYEVEGTISGLSHYMYKRWAGGNSRSGMGLQLPYENQEDLTFSGQTYISEILENFRARVNKTR